MAVLEAVLLLLLPACPPAPAPPRPPGGPPPAPDPGGGRPQHPQNPITIPWAGCWHHILPASGPTLTPRVLTMGRFLAEASPSCPCASPPRAVWVVTRGGVHPPRLTGPPEPPQHTPAAPATRTPGGGTPPRTPPRGVRPSDPTGVYAWRSHAPSETTDPVHRLCTWNLKMACGGGAPKPQNHRPSAPPVHLETSQKVSNRGLETPPYSVLNVKIGRMILTHFPVGFSGRSGRGAVSGASWVPKGPSRYPQLTPLPS